MNNTRLYLSGPMSGIDGFNYAEFYRVKALLEACGYKVESPSDIPLTDGWEWIDYVLLDIDKLFLCNGVAVLDGWESSRGARIECRIATNLGWKILPWGTWVALAEGAYI